jgi:hypothetical protein
MSIKDVLLIGRLSGIDNWSDPAIWFDPLTGSSGVPASSNKLNLELYASSNEDLGTAHKAFRANDLIGVNIGLSPPPSLAVTGFLHANEIENLSGLSVAFGSHVTVESNSGKRLVADRQ